MQNCVPTEVFHIGRSSFLCTIELILLPSFSSTSSTALPMRILTPLHVPSHVLTYEQLNALHAPFVCSGKERSAKLKIPRMYISTHREEEANGFCLSTQSCPIQWTASKVVPYLESVFLCRMVSMRNNDVALSPLLSCPLLSYLFLSSLLLFTSYLCQ